MPLLQAKESANRAATDRKLRNLNQLIADINRFQQKGRPPIPVNTKGAKTVSGIKEQHQKRLSERQNMVQKRKPVVWNRPSDYSQRLIKQQHNIQSPQKPRSSPVLQRYISLNKNKKKTVSDAIIDREYETLQRIYSPDFKLNAGSPLTYEVSSKKFLVKNTARKAQKMHSSGSSDSISITSIVTTKIGKRESSGDSDKTLTPGQECSTVTTTIVAEEKKSDLEKKTHLAKKTNFVNNTPCKQKVYPSTSKYRLLVPNVVTPRGRLKGGSHARQHLTYRNFNRIIPEVDSSLMDEISHHETVCTGVRSIPTYNLKTRLKGGSQARQHLTYRNFNRIIPEVDSSLIDEISHHETVCTGARSIPTYNLKTNNHDYIKHEIVHAIRLGKSADPLVNNMLASAIERAQMERIPWPVIKSIIDHYQDNNNRNKVLHLLQIFQKPGIFIVCTVHTCNFTKLILSLGKVMSSLKARFAPVLHHFTHCCVIEATMPRQYRNFKEATLRQYLQEDAKYFHAKQIDLLDISKGEVSIKCLPSAMTNISRILSRKGYKILNSDYCFRANREITLEGSALSNYRTLINILLNIPDIETVSDNVV